MLILMQNALVVFANAVTVTYLKLFSCQLKR